ncbi:MAG: YncE family protein [Candidatus Fermentibacteria bacterium]|nr:YncE family protein [Candidatus Fermentibacteria bacterium]
MKFPGLVLLISFMAIAQYPDTFLGSVAVGQNPMDVCISPDGLRAYAAVEFGFAAAIDINGYSDFSLAGLASLDGEPVTLQCDPTGEYLYVADGENSKVYVVDTSGLSVVKTLDIQPDPTDMVLYSPGNKIYLSHGSGMISVIDTESQTIVEIFWAGVQINSLALTPDESQIFASDNGSPEESAINATTGNLTRITSGMDSYSCAVSGNGARLFLSCPSWNIIGVMDIASSTVEGTISCTGDAPDKMAALPDLPYLYGVCPDQNIITVFGTDDLSEKGEIALPGGPSEIAVHPDGERLFVVCTGDNKIKVIGFDPSGIDTPQPGHILSAVDSPSPSPSVTVTCSEGGTVSLRAFDLSGRTVWTAETLIAQNETRQFSLGNVPVGVLTVTSTIRGTVNSVKVVAL